MLQTRRNVQRDGSNGGDRIADGWPIISVGECLASQWFSEHPLSIKSRRGRLPLAMTPSASYLVAERIQWILV